MTVVRGFGNLPEFEGPEIEWGHFITPTAYGNGCTTPTGAPTQCDITGTPLPFTPHWSYTLDGEYRHQMGNHSAFFVGAGLRGQSRSISTLYGFNIKFREIPGSDRHANIGNLPFVIPAYATVDARGGYRISGGNVTVMVWGRNILNKYYLTNVNHCLDATVRFTGMPATYGVTVSFKN